MFTDIELNGNISDERAKEIYESLSLLYSTPAGTVVLDREYGIDWSLLDHPIPIAKALLTAEYINKTNYYGPNVNVSEVNIDVEDGILKPKVVIRSDN